MRLKGVTVTIKVSSVCRDSVSLNFYSLCWLLEMWLNSIKSLFSFPWTRSTSSAARETTRVQQEIDANYANVAQLRKVSMETKLQRFCRSTLSCWLETPPRGESALRAQTQVKYQVGEEMEKCFNSSEMNKHHGSCDPRNPILRIRQ